MTFCMIVQLWNTNTPAIVSRDADLTENYMYISMKFRTGVHVFCWEVGVFNRSSFQSVSYNTQTIFCSIYIHMTFKPIDSKFRILLQSFTFTHHYQLIQQKSFPLNFFLNFMIHEPNLNGSISRNVCFTCQT